MPAPSPNTIPSRFASKGLISPVDNADSELKPESVTVDKASTPPVTITSAKPARIKSAAKPMAVAPDEQAVMMLLLGPRKPK
jgi:hypothetical protein